MIEMKIYLDFDGTIVESDYPNIGKYNTGCFDVIKKLQNAGHIIVLNSYRCEANNGTFDDAMNFLNNPLNNLKSITEFNENKIIPPEFNLQSFIQNKIIFIDDLCKGTPLKIATNKTDTTIVDFYSLDKLFLENNIY